MGLFFMVHVDVFMCAMVTGAMIVVMAGMPRSVYVLMLMIMVMGVLVIMNVGMAVRYVPVTVGMIMLVMMIMLMLMGMLVFAFHLSTSPQDGAKLAVKLYHFLPAYSS